LKCSEHMKMGVEIVFHVAWEKGIVGMNEWIDE
jgi:hypothetical protein